MRRFLLVAMTAALMLSLFAAPGAASGHERATVNVVHGIPGDSLGLDRNLTVDVCLADGTPLITNLRFQRVKRILVPAGTYDLEVRLDARHDCGGDTVLAASGVPLASGTTYSVVANLTTGSVGAASTAGLPIDLSLFVDDRSQIGGPVGRFNVRHTADAPAVDIWSKKGRGHYQPAFIGLENAAGAQQGSDEAPRGRYTAGIAINPSSSSSDIAIEVPFKVKSRKLLNIYAVGSLADGNFTVIAHYQGLER